MFQLTFDIPKTTPPIQHSDKIICVGSCFSDHIAEKLTQYKFSVLTNPYGTIFNPISIFQLLRGNMDSKRIIANGEVFYHWDTHSSISALSQEKLLQQLNASQDQLSQSVEQAQWLIITLGTSFVYKLKSDDSIVANCHKVPQNNFSKSLLSVAEIVGDYNATMLQIRKKNPSIKVLFTVSPVRHTKDGLHENNISKGILHQAIHEITASDTLSYYFPSYEIMVDELRDYRFYKSDLIHPNEQAISYIWEKFRMASIDDSTNEFITEWSKILTSIQHKPFHPESASHQKFLQSLLNKVAQFSSHADVSLELNLIKSQLITQ